MDTSVVVSLMAMGIGLVLQLIFFSFWLGGLSTRSKDLIDRFDKFIIAYRESATATAAKCEKHAEDIAALKARVNGFTTDR